MLNLIQYCNKKYILGLYVSCVVRNIECYQNVFSENTFHTVVHMKGQQSEVAEELNSVPHSRICH
jgi:uncharacterized membrane protein